MEISIGNCLNDVARKIQGQEKLKEQPEILGLRIIDGPWDRTMFIDVETKDKQYSGLIVEKDDGLLKMIAPFKIVKKDVKK